MANERNYIFSSFFSLISIIIHLLLNNYISVQYCGKSVSTAPT